MADVDSSIYNRLTAPPDPFDVPTKILGLSNSGIQNQLLGRNLQAQQVRQQALSDAFDPQTGQFDNQKYANAVQGTPAAQFLPEDIQSGQKIYGNSITNAGATQDFIKNQMTRVGQAAAAKLQSLDPKGPDFSVNDGLSVLGELKRVGIIDTPTANTLAHSMSRDPAGAKHFMTNLAQQAMPNSGTDSADLGVDPVTKAPVRGTGGQNFARSVGTVGGGGTTAPASGYIGGLTPGAKSAADVSGQQSAEQFGALRKAADATSGTRSVLANMQGFLDKLQTGPYADQLNSAKAGANNLADAFGLPPGVRFDQDTIAAGEEFKKSAAQVIQQQQQALGGTDAGFSSGKAATPNLDYSTLGNKRLLQMLQGSNDAIDFKSAAAQQWLQTHGADTYGQFLQQFNTTFSPRAFQFARMDPADQKTTWKKLSKQDRDALSRAMWTGEQNGWFTQAGATPAAPAQPAGTGQ